MVEQPFRRVKLLPKEGSILHTFPREEALTVIERGLAAGYAGKA